MQCLEGNNVAVDITPASSPKPGRRYQHCQLRWPQVSRAVSAPTFLRQRISSQYSAVRTKGTRHMFWTCRQEGHRQAVVFVLLYNRRLAVKVAPRFATEALKTTATAVASHPNILDGLNTSD